MDSQCTAMWLTRQESDIQSARRDSFAQGLQGEVRPGSLALCAEPPVLIIDVLLLGSKFRLQIHPFRQLCENRSGPFPCFSMQANCILRFLSRGRLRDTAEGKDFASRFWWALYLLLGHLLPQCTWWLLRHVLCLQCPMASIQLHSAAASNTHPQAVWEQSASGSCCDHSFSRV